MPKTSQEAWRPWPLKLLDCKLWDYTLHRHHGGPSESIPSDNVPDIEVGLLQKDVGSVVHHEGDTTMYRYLPARSLEVRNCEETGRVHIATGTSKVKHTHIAEETMMLSIVMNGIVQVD